jgi:SAM-dependent methyltransferase
MSSESEASAFWEDRYGDAPIWSGNVNRSTAAVAATLPPGTALDLGSGEGGDAIWLATNGWTVTAVEISERAIDRARAAAQGAGVTERITWVQADLADWSTDESFDLVTSSFLHSPVAFPRTDVLRRAAERVAPGGHLLVVGHAAFPPWSAHAEEHAEGHAGDHHGDDDPGSRLLTPAEQVDDLALDPGSWTIVVAELRARDATGPHGESASVEDSVVLARRA